MGIIAVTDEATVAVLESLVDLDPSTLFVVGRDSRRWIRLAVDGNDLSALPTIDTHVNQ